MLGWEPDPAEPGRSGPEPRTSLVVPLTCCLVGAVLVLSAVLGLAALREAASVDHAGVLDDPVVLEAADAACTQLVSALDAGTPPEVAVRALVAQMRGLGTERLDGDHPAQAWLADWESLRPVARMTEAAAPESCTSAVRRLEQALSTRG